MRYYFYCLSLLSVISCTQNDTPNFLPTDPPTPVQTFTIKSDRDTTLTGAKGTILMIKANSFVTSAGHDVNKQIEIKINEFYTISDFINNRLSTNTIDGRILRSSGMLFIKAASDTSTLKLKVDHPITMMFPRVQDSNTANLFSGSTGNFGEVRWTLLEPVYNDTTILETTTVTRLSYGEEMVKVSLSFIIGSDTIAMSEDNRADFEKILAPYYQKRKAESDEFWRMLAADSTDSYKPAQTRRELADGESLTTDEAYWFDQNEFYIFSTTNLGYINCDIFIEGELRPFTVKLDNNVSDVAIVLDSLNSVLYPDRIKKETNEFTFSLPDNIPVSIVAYRKDGDKHYLGLERTKSGTTTFYLKQSERPLDAIRHEMRSNWK